MSQIFEEEIPMNEKQIKELIERLTHIYALVLGWEAKTKRKIVNVADIRKEMK
jgi:hypothetical protein